MRKYFFKTLHRDLDGRFIVTLPLKQNIKSWEILWMLLLSDFSMERKFKKQPQFKQQHVQFLNEYESLGHMQRIAQRN